MTQSPEPPGFETVAAHPPQPADTSGNDARERLAAVRGEVAKAVVGQDAAVSGLLALVAAIFALRHRTMMSEPPAT